MRDMIDDLARATVLLSGLAGIDGEVAVIVRCNDEDQFNRWGAPNVWIRGQLPAHVFDLPGTRVCIVGPPRLSAAGRKLELDDMPALEAA